MSDPGLATLQSASFDWALPLQGVWGEDYGGDVRELHEGARHEFHQRMQEMAHDSTITAPLGWVLIGEGGSGKTHLGGVFRRQARDAGLWFIQVDMTDVRDFWETALQGFIDSLQQTHPQNLPQFESVLDRFLEHRIGTGLTPEMRSALMEDAIKAAAETVIKVWQKDRQMPPLSQDILRSLLYMASGDYFACNVAFSWLQGHELEAETRKEYRFLSGQVHPNEIAGGLTWIMSQTAPIALVLDQLDPIVAELATREASKDEEERLLEESLLLGIGRGLLGLRERLPRTWAIVTCLESSWVEIQKLSLTTIADRFGQEPHRLGNPDRAAQVEMLIANRMGEAAQKVGFQLPYAAWPFHASAVEQMRGESPRAVFKICDRHRQQCLKNGKVTELTDLQGKTTPVPAEGPEPAAFAKLDKLYEEAAAAARTDTILSEEREDVDLAPLIQFAASMALHENQQSFPESVNLKLDEGLPSGKVRPLHVRLRVIFEAEKEREEHFSVRVLQKMNAIAFQNRLTAAIRTAGIDRKLLFRHLRILRGSPIPGGRKTQALVHQFNEAGGKFVFPPEDELRKLSALRSLKNRRLKHFDQWVVARRPISRIPFVRSLLPSPTLWFSESDSAPIDVPKRRSRPLDTGSAFAKAAARLRQSSTPSPEPAREVRTSEKTADAPKLKPLLNTNDNGTPAEKQAEPLPQDAIPLGRRVEAGELGAPLWLSIAEQERHTVILASAGSGKTVLLKRLIEENALQGIPSIVVDGANDLAALDQAWPQIPESWEKEDLQKAKAFHERSEVVLWTPGRESGNPMRLDPLPDFSAVQDDADEMESAILMAAGALESIVATGTSRASENKKGMLISILRCFGTRGGGDLRALISLMENLPSEARMGISREDKLALEMADSLKVAIERNPMLKSRGASLDPAILFGDDEPGGKTRISVVNLVGLPELSQQQDFINQLAMTLFSWIKKNPSPPDQRKLRGLLIIDEAKDFVPSVRASSCKTSLQRLAAQARKYHLGLVFATQNAREIDSSVIGNCSTQFYGKASAPASIDAIRQQMRLKGGSGDDIPKLSRGQFYAYSSELGLNEPAKLQCPLCLSHHPKDPLEEATILSRAKGSREQLSSVPA